MLAIQFIRKNAELLKKVSQQKQIDVSIDELLALDDQRLQLLQVTEKLRQERNECSKRIAQFVTQNKTEEIEPDKEKVRKINNELTQASAQQNEVESKYQSLLMLVPNIVS